MKNRPRFDISKLSAHDSSCKCRIVLVRPAQGRVTNSLLQQRQSKLLAQKAQHHLSIEEGVEEVVSVESFLGFQGGHQEGLPSTQMN